MAMAWAGAEAAARLPVPPSAAISAPHKTVRRDAIHGVGAGEAALGAGKGRTGRMRFVSVSAGIYHRAANIADLRFSRIFGAFVALLQARIRLSGSGLVSRPRRISHGESRTRGDRRGGRRAAGGQEQGKSQWIIGS